MPHSELHKKKFKTNLAILVGIFGFCALIVAITIIKMSGA